MESRLQHDYLFRKDLMLDWKALGDITKYETLFIYFKMVDEAMVLQDHFSSFFFLNPFCFIALIDCYGTA